MSLNKVTYVDGTTVIGAQNLNDIQDSILELEQGGTVDSSLSATSENPVQNKAIKAALDGKGTYSKPSGGIPKTDLASAVQTSLGKADTAYQKPSGGIPASDLAAGVIPSLSGYATEQWVTNQGYLTPFTATAILVLSEDGQGGYTGEDAETGRVVNQLNVFKSLYMQEGKRVLLQVPVGGSTTIERFHPLGTFNQTDGAYFPVLSGNKMTGMYVLERTGWRYSDAPTIPSLADYQAKAITDTGGYYTTDTVEGALQEIGASKLDKAQGVANAGKFLVVGSDGNITAVTMTAWTGGSY